MPPEGDFTAIVLAAQRSGIVDPLAAHASVANKCLVPILEAPLIRHVVDAIRSTPGASRLRIVVEPAAIPLIETVLARDGVPIEFIAAADNLADSVYRAAEGVEEPIVVTTADNVLLTSEAIVAMLLTIADGADAALALATRNSVLAAHPEGQRRFYRFSDDAYSNCNLYAFAGPVAIKAAESFRSGGQFAKKPLRLAAAVGLLNLVLLLVGRLSLRQALARLSKRLRVRLDPVILADGAHAIDVDNARTYAAALSLLERRRAAARVAFNPG